MTSTTIPSLSSRSPKSGEILVDGGASIDEINDRFDMELSSEDFDTIGGYIFGALGRAPVPGDKVAVNGSGELTVVETMGRRITRVKLMPTRRRKPRDESGESSGEASETVVEEQGGSSEAGVVLTATIVSLRDIRADRNPTSAAAARRPEF